MGLTGEMKQTAALNGPKKTLKVKLMKILLINGSPRGERSNSLRLSRSFLDGFRETVGEPIKLEELHLSMMKVEPCRGCFACWQKTPGICRVKDDMQGVLEKELEADMIVWSFPLYYFGVPGILKNMIDRQLPLNLPFMSTREDGLGSGSHAPRYKRKDTKNVLISTCGFYSAEGNYDSVTRMFDHFLGKGNYTAIFCGQGELFRVKEVSARTDEYLSRVRAAGAEYADGGIRGETRKKLDSLLFPKEVFESMADASWGIDKTTGEAEPEDLVFTRQMAALYNKEAFDGKDRVLQMHYTDLGSTYQILLGKDGSRVVTDGSLTPTTCIETPFSVWLSISRNEISGSEALGKQMYTVTGDFSLMISWGKLFGGHEEEPDAVGGGRERSGGSSKTGEPSGSHNTSGNHFKNGTAHDALLPPSMLTMLLPWMAFWIAVSIDASTGSVITLCVCALMPLIMRRHRFILWDYLTLAAVAGLSALASLTGLGDTATNLGYLIFGIFWIVSCFTKEPLCAAYVKYSYGGDKALRNPLFTKPNYILAACWGILYLLTALWTFFLRRAGLGWLLIIINNLIPVAMGFFTVWFQKWYPAWKAAGHGKKL